MFRNDWHRPPLWWPVNEPWPPAGRSAMWRRRRGRLARRFGLFFAVMFLLSFYGASTLFSRLVGPRAIPRGTFFPSTEVVIVVGAFLLLGVFLPAMRRIGLPFGEIVEAANRVADGDLSTRVTEYGPRSLRSVGRAFNSMAERLEAQDRQSRHLMADVAHELRTPLSVIQGRLEGLLDGVYSRDDAQIGEVLEETRILARLVDDLRTLANTESGMLTLNKEPTDIPLLIRDAVGAFAVESRDRGVVLRFDPPKDLPLASVDPLRIREVLTNLLSNALRHTSNGGTVSFTVRLSEKSLQISVADTGSGIAPEDLPKIFDRFYKGSTSRGSGLGLTIARNFVAAHGGRIWAESRPGEGTTVSFSLPVGP